MYFLFRLPWAFILLAGALAIKILDCNVVLGLFGKVLVSEDAAGAPSLGRPHELPPGQKNPVPAVSKKDPLLVKEEPKNKVGSAFVRTY